MYVKDGCNIKTRIHAFLYFHKNKQVNIYIEVRICNTILFFDHRSLQNFFLPNMTKIEPINPRQFKELLILLLVILFVAMCFDYFAVADIVFQSKALDRISYKAGELLRAFYFATFSVTCFYNAKGSFQPNKQLIFKNAIKITFFIISFISIVTFLIIRSFSPKLNVFLYPILFIIAHVTITGLILNFVNNDLDINLNATELAPEKTPSDKPFAISFEAHDGLVNIPNPFRSVLVIGGAGAGKSASIAEPAIYHLIKKEFTGFVYDFKYSVLGDVVYSCFLHFNITDVKFYPVSFTDLDRSCRFNPLDPRFIESQTYVEEYSWALYSNLDKEAIKKGGFFAESAAGLLKAVIWFMKKNHPDYCTLPHIVNIILNTDTPTLVKMICSDEETKGMMKSVKEAADKEAYDQLAGVIGSLTMQLQKINTLEINWVLTGDDFTIDLNNPNNPKFIILGSHPTIRTALSPIIAFITTIALKVMNQQGKKQSVALIDEGPTIFIPNLDEIPATARSNKLAVFYMAQDFSQMDAMYGKDKRIALVSNLATQFYGNVSGYDTAKYVSDIIGKEYRMVESVNTGLSQSDSGESQSKGQSYSEQSREIIKPQDMFSLPTGTFVGKLVESEKDWFKARMKRIQDFDPTFKLQPIPVFVEDFKLNEDEIKTIENYDLILQNNIKALDHEHIDIKYLRAKVDANKMSIKDFLNETKCIMTQEFLKRKKNIILSENFAKIQQEVESIVSLYK